MRIVLTTAEQQAIAAYHAALAPLLDAVVAHLTSPASLAALWPAGHIVVQGELEEWVDDDVTLELLTRLANKLPGYNDA